MASRPPLPAIATGLDPNGIIDGCLKKDAGIPLVDGNFETATTTDKGKRLLRAHS